MSFFKATVASSSFFMSFSISWRPSFSYSCIPWYIFNCIVSCIRFLSWKFNSGLTGKAVLTGRYYLTVAAVGCVTCWVRLCSALFCLSIIALISSFSLLSFST